jgi:glycosyltransferase involved in cell wall biosynthesis
VNKEPKQLIFFGRLEERKGLPEFVEALNHLAAGNDCPPFRVAFVGKVVPLYAPDRKGIDSETFIKGLLDESIQFSIFGDFDSRGAIDFVRSSSTAVVCLTSPSDNFPNAALEAGQIPHRLVVSDRAFIRRWV